MEFSNSAAQWIFIITIFITFVAAYLGGKHARNREEQGLTSQSLNKWLIGLSAGATANSGFVVTGAVGLGYMYGFQWLFLPIAWLLGDIVFWYFFPSRINAVGRSSQATTLSEMLVHGLTGKTAKVASVIATTIIVISLGGYTSAQWLAGEKFLAGAFAMPNELSLLLFACIIIAYTTIGGFRGSVYADSVQAIIRIIGTLIAIGAVILVAMNDPGFSNNFHAAGNSFMQILPGSTVASFFGFMLGFAAAALGFGLGQPQLVSRYLAGSSPEETKSAWWIYIGFVQFTWIAMTLFGIILRGVMPDISDPEQGLSLFFSANMGPLVTGIIVADIFATIAATSNSLLVAISQAILHDLLPKNINQTSTRKISALLVVVLGAATMAGAFFLSGKSSVFQVALSSVSLMGAGLAAPVMIKVMNWQRSGTSLLCSICFGFLAAIIWKYFGMANLLNEAAIGIVLGLIVNWTIIRFSPSVIVLQEQK